MNWDNMQGEAEAAAFWHRSQDMALAFMATRRHLPSALIEVSAQHPLQDGRVPGEEFRARLDKGLELYHELSATIAVQIYVPGSRHRHKGVDDAVSLSLAGCSYLRERGLPEEVLHGDDLNERYKGQDGVYGSADEAFVASSYFRDAGLGQLLSVMSPAQVMRKSLHYVAFGVYPLSHTAPVVAAFHDFVTEALGGVPNALFVDHDLQAVDSAEADRLRRSRHPRAETSRVVESGEGGDISGAGSAERPGPRQ
jgi:hypothetical protein